MHDPYRSLYLHVPFCARRCRYCDFETEAVDAGDGRVQAYAEQMVAEIRQSAKRGFLDRMETVYFGGGTPTFASRALVQMLYTLSVSMAMTGVECSVEANPESVSAGLVRDIWALGANRMSIGVQSFDDDVLGLLGRIHDADGARRAVACAQERFDNVSVDVMCGIPGQSAESLARSVTEALRLGVKHVSVYPLTVERNTPFWKMAAAGKMQLPDPDVQADHMQLAAELLEGAGLARYEVASYAAPGFECRHNMAYWTGVPYLGLGPSAVTMTQDATRRMRKQDGFVVDELDARQMLAENLMLRMRMTAGIPDELAEDAAGLLPQLRETLATLASKGLVEHAHGAWRPTNAGWLCGNDLYGALFDLAP